MRFGMDVREPLEDQLLDDFVDFSNAARRHGCVDIRVLYGDSTALCELNEFRAWVRFRLGLGANELPASWLYVDGEVEGRRFAWVGVGCRRSATVSEER